MARKVFTSAAAVNQLEHGKKNPTLFTLIKYANALGMELRVKLVKLKKS